MSESTSPCPDTTRGCDSATHVDDPATDDRFRRLALGLLVLGVSLRLALAAAAHPLYMDEAYLTLNLLDREYLGLAGPLHDNQVAPLLFLWVEKAAYQLFGPGEIGLRLVPVLAGIAALVLFWFLARVTVRPPAAALAVGLLAVSRWPLHMTAQVKPYSLDLLAAVGLLTLAACWLRRPNQARWPALLAAAVPVALGLSYPAAFVAAAVGLVLLPTGWRSARPAARAWFVVYLLLAAASFAAFDLWVGRRQLGRAGDGTHDFMHGFWQDAFPPSAPSDLPAWLLAVHIGPLTGYPYGNGNAAGLVAFPLMLIGAWAMWRAGDRRVLALLLAPFALTLAAAFLQKYPYGGCTRVAQHLAPGVCLLAGAGTAELIGRTWRAAAGRWWTTVMAAATLALFGVGHVAYWHLRPWRDPEDRWAADVAAGVAARVGPGERVVLPPLPESVRPGLIWYLRVGGVTPVLPGEPNRPGDHGRGPGWALTAAGEPGDTKGVPLIDRPATEVARAAGGTPVAAEPRFTFELPARTRGKCMLRADLWAVTPAAR